MKALDIAKYIVSKCTADGRPISNLQLQKILYYIQVAFLKEKAMPCFSDEIEAWMFGPVVRNVYIHFSTYAAVPIISLDETYLPLCEDDKRLIDSIVETKRKARPWELVNDTHKQGKAWDIVYRNGKGDKQVIDKELLKQYG